MVGGLLPMEVVAVQVKVWFENYCNDALHVKLLQVESNPESKQLETVIGSRESGWFQFDNQIANKFEVKLTGATKLSTSVTITEPNTVKCRVVDDALACKIHYTGERWETLVKEAYQNCSHELAKDPQDAKHFCHPSHTEWHYTQCRFDMTHEKFAKLHFRRKWEALQLVDTQPQGLQNFTDIPWSVATMPNDVMQLLWSYYLEHRLRDSVPENREVFDGTLSGCESNTWLLALPEWLQQKVIDIVKPLVAEWANIPESKLTLKEFHGIRMYRGGSRLRNHVEDKHKHALSAELEVAHLDFGLPDHEVDGDRTPWSFIIADHNGDPRTVYNKVGQLVMYESATCAHSREGSFLGREFASIFLHFAPDGWPDAFKASPGASGSSVGAAHGGQEHASQGTMSAMGAPEGRTEL